MAFCDFFKRLRSPIAPKSMGYVGQPVEAVSSVHPDHYTKEQNASRIEHLTAAIKQWKEHSWPEEFPEKFKELNTELQRHINLRRLFHGGE